MENIFTKFIDELKKELKDELKKELKYELKHELKKELKHELKKELKHELKKELKHELKKELIKELENELEEKVYTIENIIVPVTYKLFELFDIHHKGIVPGRPFFYNDDLGNVDMLFDKNKFRKIIYINDITQMTKNRMDYLEEYKEELETRDGANRNKKKWYELQESNFIQEKFGNLCIFVKVNKCIKKNSDKFFIEKYTYNIKELIHIHPKNVIATNNLEKIVDILNKTYSGEVSASLLEEFEIELLL